MIDIKEILGEKDFNDFLDYNPENLHVIKFGATWCGPCKSLESRMKNIDSDKIGNTLFAEIDISENDECEEVADRTVGLVTLDDIYNRINKLSE